MPKKNTAMYECGLMTSRAPNNKAGWQEQIPPVLFRVTALHYDKERTLTIEVFLT